LGEAQVGCYTQTMGVEERPAEDSLGTLLAERIVVIDGAMGTMLQAERLGERDFRGDRFRDHPKDLKGNSDLLSLTRPDVIEKIHREYLRAGADIVETNTFTGTSISQADYGLEALAYEMNVAGAGAARRAVDRVMAEQPGRMAWVAGSLGPTTRSASLSRDVNDPGARLVTFDELVAAYHEQARGLLDGGANLLLVETIFDSLNGKAAFFAIERLFGERGIRVPVMASVTITDRAGNLGPDSGPVSFVVDDPLFCVVRGVGIALENLPAFKRSIMSWK